MPARSQAQQRFMAGCEHSPKHMHGCPTGMTVQQLHEFASTPRKGLPMHVKSKRRGLSQMLGEK